MRQLQLLGQRGFGSLFGTQFLGAFNDNLFKTAVSFMITFRSMKLLGLNSGTLVPFAALVFISSFFLFSATAGQLSDKFSKTRIMRWVKLAEIFVMLGAALGFLLNNLAILMVVLFFMGLQSTFFGPAKYSVLPELVADEELVGANAVVEMGTFLAILLGTIAGGVMSAIEGSGLRYVGGSVVGIAVMGWITSQMLPVTAPAVPDLPLQWDPVRPTWSIFRTTRKNRTVFLSILGISWFWFVGASFLTLLLPYAKDVLKSGEHVVTLLLAMFSIGIAVGSLLCERISDRYLDLALVPIGALGISLFALDIFVVGDPYAGIEVPAQLSSISEFLRAPSGVRVAFDLFMIAVSGGLFTVPLYTLVQRRSLPSERSRVIAGNNILNALLMVVSGAMLMGLSHVGVSIPHTFLIVSILNVLVATYIFTVLPEFVLRTFAWVIAKIMYRRTIEGDEHTPVDGPAVFVCNHVSFVDWLLVASSCPRPVRFVMHHTYFEIPVVEWLFRMAKVIPIAPAHEDGKTLEVALDKIATELEDGELVCIFPEGKVSRTGEINIFRTGIERIIKRTPVPVVPMAIQGMWGSYFSFGGGGLFKNPFARIRSKIIVTFGEPIPPANVSADKLQEIVEAMLAGTSRG